MFIEVKIDIDDRSFIDKSNKGGSKNENLKLNIENLLTVTFCLVFYLSAKLSASQFSKQKATHPH